MNKLTPSILVVDNDDTFRKVLAKELSASGLDVETRSRGQDVEVALVESAYDVVVLDLKMPGMDGIATLERIKAVRPLTEVIMLTGHGSFESAVRALKLGAYDFLAKPCDLDHLESVIRRAVKARAMQSENEALRKALSRRGDATELIGRSPAIRRVRALVEKVAPTSSTILIRGESGTGKEVAARAIQRLSTRSEHPFVVLDCGATEENLALSELFGHEKGAYTGANDSKHGLFELADSGTVLIDEVGDASASLQTRLLRRLGSEGSIHVDVRILGSTHRDLEAQVQEGTFREDLYYRLNVLTVHIPPLRERIEDIPLFVELFLKQLCPAGVPEVEDEAMSLLLGYHWPGNIRELRNVIERAVILSDGKRIQAEKFPTNLSRREQPWEIEPGEKPLSLQEVDRRYITTLLARYDGDRSRVAKVLGISERTLYRKLRKEE